jgi:hypothetical protein
MSYYDGYNVNSEEIGRSFSPRPMSKSPSLSYRSAERQDPIDNEIEKRNYPFDEIRQSGTPINKSPSSRSVAPSSSKPISSVRSSSDRSSSDRSSSGSRSPISQQTMDQPPKPVISRSSSTVSSSRSPSVSSSRSAPRATSPPRSISSASPSRSASSRMMSQEENITDDEKNVLTSNGYMLRRIIDVANSDSEVRYVFATNKRGQMVLINMDGNDNMKGKVTKSKVIKPTKDSHIPYSMQKGAYDCINGVCGVAFDTNEQLSLVLRDNDTLEGELETVNYRAKNVIAFGDNVPMPVINFKDIVYNPQAILDNTDATTMAIHTKYYGTSNVEMKDTVRKLKETLMSAESFVQSQHRFSEELARSINELRTLAFDYESSPPIGDSQREKYELVKYNLARRNDLIAELIHMCNKFVELKKQITDVKIAIDELEETCVKDFANLNRVMK